jgi:sulfonate transport system permease protein
MRDDLAAAEAMRTACASASPGDGEAYYPTFLGIPLPYYSIAIVVIGWQAAAYLFGRSAMTGALVVPSIGETFGAFKSFAYHWPGGLGAGDTRMGAPITYWGAVLGLAYNVAFTIMRLFIGLVLGLGAGIGLAFLLSWSRTLREAVSFPAHFLRMMPLLALIPLFALWFSDKNVGSIVFVAVSVFVLMFAVTLNAIGNVPDYYSLYARSLGAGPFRTYATVVFPAAFPQLRGGILLSLGFSWNAVLASEFLGLRNGLGRIVMYAQEFGITETIALAAMIGVFLSALSFLIVNSIFTWMVRWAD